MQGDMTDKEVLKELEDAFENFFETWKSVPQPRRPVCMTKTAFILARIRKEFRKRCGVLK